MFTAGKSFDHIIQTERNDDHVLVTWGIFGTMRHPSYVGWYMWSVGTQLVLCNPVCLVAYTIVSWNFFNDRIQYEEYMLINFFGDAYIEYQKKVPTGLPFMKGFLIQEYLMNGERINSRE